MGCIRVEKVLDYLCVPLEKALKDKDAYVRMTAVLCVPKVYSLSPSLAEENGFIETLREMLSDNTASVMACPRLIIPSSSHCLLVGCGECGGGPDGHSTPESSTAHP